MSGLTRSKPPITKFTEIIKDALIYVGLEDITSLIMGSEVIMAFEDIPYHDNPHRFWYENMFAAISAQVIARHKALPEGRLFTAALLRGVSELIICCIVPSMIQDITKERYKTSDPLFEVEDRMLNYNYVNLAVEPFTLRNSKHHIANSVLYRP